LQLDISGCVQVSSLLGQVLKPMQDAKLSAAPSLKTDQFPKSISVNDKRKTAEILLWTSHGYYSVS
jgi:hypothetical protein